MSTLGGAESQLRPLSCGPQSSRVRSRCCPGWSVLQIKFVSQELQAIPHPSQQLPGPFLFLCARSHTQLLCVDPREGMGTCVASESGPLFSSVQHHKAYTRPVAALTPLQSFPLGSQSTFQLCPWSSPLNPLVRSPPAGSIVLFVFLFKASRQGFDDPACQVWQSCWLVLPACSYKGWC